MTAPLALVRYRNLLSGSQLVNRLHDLGYRVEILEDDVPLHEATASRMPMVLITELSEADPDWIEGIALLRQAPVTAHVPVLAFVEAGDAALQNRVQEAGATLVASAQGFLSQLPLLLEQVLQVD